MNSFRLVKSYPFPLAVPVHRECGAATTLNGAAAPFERAEPGLGVAPSGGHGIGEAHHPMERRPAGHEPMGRGEVPGRGARVVFTVLLAEDHPVVRQSLKKLLHQQTDLRVVGESCNGLETLNLVKQLQPDLLVTDLMMPGMNGLEVTRRVRLSYPGTRVLVVSVNGDEPYVAGALRCGANGFVLKTSCGRHLLPGIRAILAGRRFVSPPLPDPLA